SPTIASVARGRSVKERSSTALMMPTRVKKYVRSPTTLRTGRPGPASGRLASAASELGRFISISHPVTLSQLRCLGSRMSRSASPKRFVPNTARLMAMPGKMTSHASYRMDERDLYGDNGILQRWAERRRHHQRQHQKRQGLQDIHHALDDEIDPAAEVTGGEPEDDAEAASQDRRADPHRKRN